MQEMRAARDEINGPRPALSFFGFRAPCGSFAALSTL
jgi:hypothetical protein